MLTGRRDGRISQASDVSNLPAPFDSVDVQKQKFTAKGLNTQDLVTLVGNYTYTYISLFTHFKSTIELIIISNRTHTFHIVYITVAL